MKHLLGLVLCICSFALFSQNYRERPFLEMQTTVSGKPKVYRLKWKKTIWVKTITDEKFIKDKIMGFTNDSALMLKNHGIVGMHEIDSVVFFPQRLPRTVRQFYYTIGAINELVLLGFVVTTPFSEATGAGIAYLIITPVYLIMATETIAAALRIVRGRVSLNRQNTYFLIRYRETPAHQQQEPPSPYTPRVKERKY